MKDYDKSKLLNTLHDIIDKEAFPLIRIFTISELITFYKDDHQETNQKLVETLQQVVDEVKQRDGGNGILPPAKGLEPLTNAVNAIIVDYNENHKDRSARKLGSLAVYVRGFDVFYGVALFPSENEKKRFILDELRAAVDYYIGEEKE